MLRVVFRLLFAICCVLFVAFSVMLNVFGGLMCCLVVVWCCLLFGLLLFVV